MSEQIKKNKNVSFKNSLKELEEERKRLEKKVAKLKCECLHKSKGGKLKLSPLPNSMSKSVVICDKCGEVFDIAPVDQDELEKAIEVIHNTIQQIRCISRQDKESDVKLCEIYGDIDYNVKQLGVVYSKLNKKVGDGKHKHKKQNNEYGYYKNKVKFL